MTDNPKDWNYNDQYCGCVDITGQRLLEPGEDGHGCHLRNLATIEITYEDYLSYEDLEALDWQP